MSASVSKLFAALGLVACACGEPAQYRFGTNVTGLRFTPTSAREGIYPDQTVTVDPNNPFRVYPLSKDTKWQLLSGGALVASYYAFATALVGEPTGENQFYAAKLLGDIAGANALNDPTQHDQVVQMAIDGNQAMLDHFPDAVSYDATGTIAFRLATPAYKAIIALGGKVQGSWLLVTTANGDEAVQSSRSPSPDGGVP
jgi:hypothetical protein